LTVEPHRIAALTEVLGGLFSTQERRHSWRIIQSPRIPMTVNPFKAYFKKKTLTGLAKTCG